ncbi:MAG: hypothetical protein ACFFBC_15185 [Promethearchaeota archaeon]
MVHVMVKVKYPPHILEEFLKFYLSGKAPKYPDYVKRINQWVISGYEYKTINIYELPEEKLYEGIKGIAKRFSAYAAFKGYKYKIIPLIEGSEALDMMK